MSMAQPRHRQGFMTWLFDRVRRFQSAWSRADPEAWAPMPAASSGAQDRDVTREVDQIARASADVGPMTARGLANIVGARFWGPRRFQRALRAAQKQGRIRRVGRSRFGSRLYGPPR